MPFIKKTDTKDARHFIDARKIFIGRSMELQFFKEFILKPELMVRSNSDNILKLR